MAKVASYGQSGQLWPKWPVMAKVASYGHRLVGCTASPLGMSRRDSFSIMAHLWRSDAVSERQSCYLSLLFFQFLESTDEIICIPDEAGFPATIWDNYFLKPQVQCIVQIHSGEDGRNYSSWRSTRYRVQYLPICIQHSCLQPLLDKPQQRFVIYSLRNDISL
jgi:hypothetical protein